MEERWKDVPNTDGLYQVSSLGRVRSRRKLNGWLLPEGEWRDCKQSISRRGGEGNNYAMVSISGSLKCVHSLVLETFVGERPEGAVARHLDGNGLNNTQENLRWGTTQENNRDIHRHRRGHTQKTTMEQVAELKWKLANGEVNQEYLNSICVNKKMLSNIRTGATWGWVEPQAPQMQ